MRAPIGRRRERRCTAARAISSSRTQTLVELGVVKLSRRDHRRRSRTARRPAERARPVSRRPTRSRSSTCSAPRTCRSSRCRRSSARSGCRRWRCRAGVRRHHAPPGTRYTALVPNLSGLDRALRRRRHRESRSSRRRRETFSRKNINQSIDESLATYTAGLRRGAGRGPARARVSVDGVRLSLRRRGRAGDGRDARRATDRPRRVRSRRSATRSASPIPGRCRSVLEAVLARVPADRIALHFHDTRGTALANVLTALPLRRRDVRRVGGRTRRLSVRARRGRQPGHRRLDLHAEWIGDRDRRLAGGLDRGVGFIAAGSITRCRPVCAGAARCSGTAADCVRRYDASAVTFKSQL